MQNCVTHPGYFNKTPVKTGAMALNLKDRDDKWHDTIKKYGRIGRGPPALYSVTAQLSKRKRKKKGLHMAFEEKIFIIK